MYISKDCSVVSISVKVNRFIPLYPNYKLPPSPETYRVLVIDSVYADPRPDAIAKYRGQYL